MKLVPVGDRIIVGIDIPDVSAKPIVHATGLHLPDETRDDHIVLAAGPGKYLADGSRAPMAVVPGDRAVFDEWRCQKFSWPEYQHYRRLACVSQDDLCGVISKEDGGMFHALNDLLICEQLPNERKVGMILLPAIADDRDEAIIRMIGCGKWRSDGTIESARDYGFEAGERVLYHKRMGRHFTLNGKKYVAFEPKFVFCVIDDAQTELFTTTEVAEA